MLVKDMTVEQLEALIDKKLDEKLDGFLLEVEDYTVALERSKAKGRERFTTQELREKLDL
jgi:hypothetical protein